jgi:hypothetical protein
MLVCAVRAGVENFDVSSLVVIKSPPHVTTVSDLQGMANLGEDESGLSLVVYHVPNGAVLKGEGGDVLHDGPPLVARKI